METHGRRCFSSLANPKWVGAFVKSIARAEANRCSSGKKKKKKRKRKKERKKEKKKDSCLEFVQLTDFGGLEGAASAWHQDALNMKHP